MNFSNLALFVAAVLIVGCSKNEAAPTETPKDEPKTGAAQTSPAETTLASFKNEKGELVCPVSGDIIASEDKAVGHQDYEGKRYFFCCGSCEAPFKKEPAKYADGANLKNGKPGMPMPDHSEGAH